MKIFDDGFNDCLSFIQEFGTDCFCLVLITYDAETTIIHLVAVSEVSSCLLRFN